MRILLATALLLGAAGAAHAAGSSRSGKPACGELATMSFKDTRITTAEAVNGGRFDYPPSLFNALAGDHAFMENVSFCRVAGVIDGTIRFELWLPADWNRKFQGVGNGGYTGAINFPSMGAAVARGYATASTDTGHQSTDMFDISWMDGDNQDLMNFTHRSQHLLAVRSKSIISAFYGRTPQYNYFNGCST